MAQPAINLVHIMKPPTRTLFNSSLRIGFLRAWFFTALKVLFIAGLISGTGLLAKVESNVLLLDSYVRGDFTAYEYSYLPQPTRHGSLKKTTTKVIIAQDFQPRGPELGEVAGLNTVKE